MADVVRRMIRKGLIRRGRTKGDARTNAIDLTDQGHLAVKAVGSAAAMAGDQLLAVLPARQRRRFIESLRAIINCLSE